MAQPQTSRRLSTFFVYVTMAAYWFAPIRTCPVNCTCVSDPFMVVVCSGQGFTTIPKEIPKNTVTLNLAYNKISVLDLRTLYDLESLERVDFSSNEIKTIHGSFESFKKLYIIDLSRNNIEAIPWTTFRNVLPQMNVLHLGGNPFNCDCNQRDTDQCDCSGDIFQCTCTCTMQWLQEQVKEYPNLGWDVTCQNPVTVRGKAIEEVTFMPHGYPVGNGVAEVPQNNEQGEHYNEENGQTVGNLVRALEVFDDGAIDEDKFDFFLQSSEVTSQNPEETSNQGPVHYNNEDIPEETRTFLRLIASKLNLDLFPLENEEAEAQRLKKITSYQTRSMLEGSSGSPGFDKNGNAILLHKRVPVRHRRRSTPRKSGYKYTLKGRLY
ncbi:SLIT2 [Branchiostoma lanceolatum]|uniref:SLIT2 protein n=1 Tax=Branchiostoma lanceolatum TaxID=7740 RepID=A0A8J9Z856_BRALA|nr:SLIT2 [Branchiostoma lanceolatum]